MLYTDAVLMRQRQEGMSRSLTHHCFPSLRCGYYHGVGRGAVPGRCQADGDVMLLPSFVTEYRTVRLFTGRHSQDPYLREKVGWMRSATVEAVNAALAQLQQCKDDPDLQK